jgi:hypothetical protein
VNHSILKGFQEVLLEFEVRQFFLLQKAHCKLAQGIESEKANVRIAMTADLSRDKALEVKNSTVDFVYLVKMLS